MEYRVISQWKYFVVFVATFAYCKAQTCSPTECGVPPTNDNTSYKPKKSCYSVNEKIEYMCTGNFGGPPFNLCTERGTWSLPPPVCEVFTCQAPLVARNVSLNPNQTVYDTRVTVEYSCGNSAALVGPSSASCDSQDTWSPSTIPLCVAICLVPAINNGQVFPADIAFKNGDSAFVSCDDGYGFEVGESSNIVCGDNGNWNQIPTCKDVNECDYSPCANNGECLNFGGGYNCTCTPQWQGRNCETDVNECLTNPCQNNADCDNYDGGYQCVCQSGWEGVNCETVASYDKDRILWSYSNVNECDCSPCANNGECVNFDGGYNCTCTPQWQGTNCETDINECLANPCQNNAVCENYGGGYQCICQSGWEGINCETDIDECVLVLCENNGVCVNFDGGYNCTCNAQWQGVNCETDINECAYVPCLNNGVCTNFDGGYNCTCERGWRGANCEIDFDECFYNPCQNGGVCTNYNGGYNCSCPSGWQGVNCETDMNECDVNPCFNNGVCNNYEGGYNCTCERGWSGRHCETDINECVFNHCQNGGVCTSYNGGYNCTCQEGWHGVNCENVPESCFIPSIDNSNTQNGMNITHGENYIIRCDRGYSFNQRTEFQVSCTRGDLVSSDYIPDKCYDCARQNLPLHGNVTKGIRYGEVVEYSCNRGYKLEGPTSSICNYGVWEPSQPSICNAICPPPAIPNARLTPENVTFTEGDRAHVTCDAGYTVARGSSSTILCQGDGTWDQLPECLAPCMVPPIENSNAEDNLTLNHGEIFSIRCDGGYSYDFRTIFQVTCVNGDLVPMDVIPQACYRSCMVPPIENSNTDEGEVLHHGESYIIRCNGDYSFNQRSSFRITCNNGELVPPSMVPETCYQDCQSREAPHNGAVGLGKRHGKAVEYSCEQGFLLVGPSSTTCNDGRWEPEETPSCEAICPAPFVENGHVTPTEVTFTEGDRAYVTCDAGHTLDPIQPLTCQSDGSWDQIPYCLSYCMVPPVDNSNTQSGQNISHGQHYVIQCARGFSYNQRGEFDVFCSNGDLVLTDVIPESCFRDCPPRQGPQNGDVTQGRRHGETVEYSCNPGFLLTGPSFSTCNEGRWEPGQTPTCEIICPVPTIDDGKLNPVDVTFKEGDRANVSCNPGFSLAGQSSSVVCRPDGTWSAIPRCIETCEIPPVLNSNTASGMTLDHSVHYTIVCDEGFSYDQAVIFDVTCIEGELVSDSVLPDICYRDCPVRFMGPPNGNVTGGRRHGETVYYSCQTGYLLEGPPSATCVDGLWDPVRQPTCSVICPTPTIDNAKVIPSNITLTEGDTAVVACEEGFYLQDEASPNMICLSSGQWDQIPRCIELCFIPAVPNSNFQSGGSLEYGDAAIIRCNQGFSFNQKALFRVSCSDGELVPGTVIPDACFRDCSPRIPPEHGDVTPECEYQHGVTVEYSCWAGFELRGPESATCKDGRWDPMRYPMCVEESHSDDGVSLHCLENVFRVVIPGRLLINQSESIHLKDSNCVGRRQPNGDVIVESHYDNCETIQEVDNENKKIIYKNVVSDMVAPRSSASTSSTHVNIDVECLFDQDKLVSTNYALISSLRQSLSQTGEYDVSFSLYTDDTFSEIQETPVFVEETKRIFLKVQVETEVSGLSLLGTRCWATPTDNPDHDVFTNLIENGCPADGHNVKIASNFDPTSKPSFAFSASLLQFPQSNVVYVHCNTRICEANLLGDCRPFCSGFPRSKRSSGLTLSRRISQGPIIKEMSSHPGEVTWPLPAVVALCVFSFLTVCGLVLVSILFAFRRNTVKSTAENNIY